MPDWLREWIGIAWDLAKFVAALAIVVGLFHYAIVWLLWSLGD